ncbi:uncharacterized protein METZ01_LOCUS58324 [marine metagenome]|uniref:Uncharacterized protein n=1 Tax=marine metagenome TaxID=408172 RepID=A0A381SN71_9ZZZZ
MGIFHDSLRYLYHSGRCLLRTYQGIKCFACGEECNLRAIWTYTE